MMRKLMLIMAMALVLGGALAMSAQANPVLDFSMSPPTSGTVTFFGPASVLSGDSIQVDSVTGIDTPLHSGVTLNLLSGLMFFETGTFASLGSGEYNFNTGSGFLHIFGGISAGGISIPTGTELLDGFPLTSPPSPHVVLTPTGGTVVLNFSDSKDRTLLDYFGLTGSAGGSLNLSFATNTPINPSSPTPFSSSFVLSGDVPNAFGPAVPVPPSLLLLGSGLLGLVGLGRIRKN